MTSGTTELIAGRYEPLRELGRGGMGRVLAARDRAQGREVAIKLIHDRLFDAQSEARFQREAQAVGRLSHPNIVAILDVGRDGDRPFLVAELLEGETLKELFARGPVPERHVAELAVQLARGLGAAHAEQIVHRDLKPANVFVTKSGAVKLLDFGVAKWLGKSSENSGDVSLTESGHAMGTLGYMAPEQVRGRPVSERSDIFSLGVILHELLSGQRLYQRGSAVESGYAIISEEPRPLPANISPEMSTLVLSCLSKKASERPSAKEVIDRLERLLGLAAARSEEQLAAQRRARKIRVGALSFGLLLFASAGLAAWHFKPWQVRIVPGALEGPIAVFPFTYSGDAAHDFLGEGAVDLVGRSIESLDLKRTEPKRVTYEMSQGKSPLEIARMLGAKSFVTGAVKVSGDSLQLSAELRDARDGSIHQQASVAGAFSNVLAPYAKLATQLAESLRTKNGSALAGGRSAKVTSILNPSITVIEDMLRGEAAFRRNDLQSAWESFRRASHADQAAALALLRAAQSDLAFYKEMQQELELAKYTNVTLTAHERDLLEDLTDLARGRISSSEARAKELLAANPEDLDALAMLSELLFLWNPLRDRPLDEAEPVLNRLLALDPENPKGLIRSFELAVVHQDHGLASSFAARIARLPDGASGIADLSPGLAGEFKSGNPLFTRAGGGYELVAQDRNLRVAFALAQWDDETLAEEYGLANEVSRRSDIIRDYGFNRLAINQLARGRPIASADTFSKVTWSRAMPGLFYYWHYHDALPIYPMTPEQMRVERDQLDAYDSAADTTYLRWFLHLRGMLALRAGDLDAARRNVAELKKMPNEDESIAGDLALELEAEIAAAQGNDDEALRLLDAMELRIDYPSLSLFGHVAPRHLRAKIYARQHRDAEALRLLELADFDDTLAPLYMAPDLLAEADLLERDGRPAEAAAKLRRFAKLWADCEPAQRPLRDQALERAQRLEAKVGSPIAAQIQSR